jgi:hypothetical protein
MNIKSIVKKVNKALSKVKATSGVAYKRVTTLPGYDPLLGTTTGPATVVDTLMVPQPAISTLDRNSPLVLNNSGKFLATDLFALVSADSFTAQELKGSNVTIVFKEGSIVKECSIVYYSDQGFLNSRTNWNMVLRVKSEKV